MYKTYRTQRINKNWGPQISCQVDDNILYNTVYTKDMIKNDRTCIYIYLYSKIQYIICIYIFTRYVYIHPRHLTWILKIAMFKGSYLFQTIILGIHVGFRGGQPLRLVEEVLRLDRRGQRATTLFPGWCQNTFCYTPEV